MILSINLLPYITDISIFAYFLSDKASIIFFNKDMNVIGHHT